MLMNIFIFHLYAYNCFFERKDFITSFSTLHFCGNQTNPHLC